MKEEIQTSAKYLANLCLENDQEHHEYTEKDLENATLIFAHFLMDVTYTKNFKELSKDGMIALAETTGKMVRELIRAATGLDMHEIVKKKG